MVITRKKVSRLLSKTSSVIPDPDPSTPVGAIIAVWPESYSDPVIIKDYNTPTTIVIDGLRAAPGHLTEEISVFYNKDYANAQGSFRNFFKSYARDDNVNEIRIYDLEFPKDNETHDIPSEEHALSFCFKDTEASRLYLGISGTALNARDSQGRQTNITLIFKNIGGVKSLTYKTNSAFEGSNEIRHLNKSSVNVTSGSTALTVDATRAFARTVPFSASDIGYVTVDPSLMTTEKSGVTYNISESLDQRSTNLDGDPTFFAATPRGGTNSAVDVIPVVTSSNNGLMNPTMLNRLNDLALVRNETKTATTAFHLSLPSLSRSWYDVRTPSIAPFYYGSYSGWNPWIIAKNAANVACIGNYDNGLHMGICNDSESSNRLTYRLWINGNGSAGIDNSTWTASKIYNAVWNDYAELFERGSKTEAGDIIMLDINSDKEKYVLAERGHGPVVGVHSDTYAQLIGGEKVPEGQNTDHYTYNAPRFIPIGLAGRVNVKVTGEIRKGQRICLSEIPGVGRAVLNGFDDNYLVGIALENHTGDEIDRIKMFIKL